MAGKRITIEICSNDNNSHWFGPTGQLLRGRWTAANVARMDMHASLKKVSEMPFIPGICLEVDLDTRTCRQFDPLRETEEGKRIWKAIAPVLAHFKGMLCREGAEPWEETKIENADLDTIKDWLYWMRRAVDNGLAVVSDKSTPLPAIDAISKMPGKRKTTHWSSQKLSDEDQFADVVPLPGKTGSVA